MSIRWRISYLNKRYRTLPLKERQDNYCEHRTDYKTFLQGVASLGKIAIVDIGSFFQFATSFYIKN